ncbi:hypothetical protein J3459_010822 [Metarhizium acridum]|nr:hypothetical protein J3459_010822 [Metarhizium acridum]
MPMLLLTAHRSEPIQKMTTAPMRTGFRPKCLKSCPMSAQRWHCRGGRRSDPDVAQAGVEGARYGRDGGGDDGHVEGGQEERQTKGQDNEEGLDIGTLSFWFRLWFISHRTGV